MLHSVYNYYVLLCFKHSNGTFSMPLLCFAMF